MTTRVTQDGQHIRLGTFENFAEIYYDVSADVLIIQSPTSNTDNAVLDRISIGLTATVVNEGGVDRDWRIEGDNNANLIVGDAGTDSLAFGAAVDV